MSQLHWVKKKSYAWLSFTTATLLNLVVTTPLPGATVTPKVVITGEQPEIFLNGDCNNPAVWVDGELRVYYSTSPQSNGFTGGVATYYHGASLDTLTNLACVYADRSRLNTEATIAFGPWFESVIADDDGVLWAYYHAEFVHPELPKIHPRIGAQVSRDKGQTWEDLGIIIDTPADTDELHSWLGYGFSGGNGDCSAILDREKNYIYFLYSQYGATPETQGIAIARMRWSDRAAPSGKVYKWHQGTWEEPGLGGLTTPLLANTGDAHGLRTPFDFWWGPSIHWNTFLQRYVILLNRSNNGGFTNTDDMAFWYMTSPNLDNPTLWDNPAPLPFPETVTGAWYPQVIGTEPGETDNLAGQTARLFVNGISTWNITFEKPSPPSFPTQPVLTIFADDKTHDLEVTAGTTLTLTGQATDADGDMLEHWLEIQNPTGTWSWEGWLTTEPWAGALIGSSTASTKAAAFTFTQPGTYTVRTTAIDTAGYWLISPELHIKVAPTVIPPTLGVQIAMNGSESNQHVALGTTLTLTSRATNPTGTMAGHWLEVCNPAGIWNWEGWLLTDPWMGDLVGDCFSSNKTATFTFTEPGIYLVRSTTVNTYNQWLISTQLAVTVLPP